MTTPIKANRTGTDVTSLGEFNPGDVIPIEHGGTGQATLAGAKTALGIDDKVDKVAGKGLSEADFTDAEKTKLAGIASGATANATDAQLRDRATHTGEQAIGTVTGLQSALDGKQAAGSYEAAGAAGAAVTAHEAAGNPHPQYANAAATTTALASKADLVGGKVPTSQLPDAVLGALSYQGTWNATTNTPAIPAAAAGNKGHYYVVAVAGTTSIDGEADWNIGDWIVSSGAVWSKVDNSDKVSSVAGRTGAVVLTQADVGITDTDDIAEGSNLYFTVQRVRDTVLTGLSTATNAVITAADTALQAWGKLQAQISANLTTLLARTGNAGAIQFRNRIPNGNMVINQRGTASLASVAGYIADGWYFEPTTMPVTAYHTASSNGISLSGKNHLTIQATSTDAPTAGEFMVLLYAAEGYDVADLRWGYADAKSVTLQLRAYLSAGTQVISIALRNAALNRSYVTTLTLTDAIAEYTVTVPGCTDGTWETTTAAGLILSICLDANTAGTYATSTLNSWTSSAAFNANTQGHLCDTTSKAIFLSDVQLEVGTVKTPYELRPYASMLAACERTLEVGETSSILAGVSPTGWYLPVHFRAVKRTVPAITRTGNGSLSSGTAGTTVYNPQTYRFYFYNTTNAVGGSWVASSEFF